MRAFVLSHFSYCPFVWKFYDRTSDHRINRVHERALRITSKDWNNFGFLLEQTKSVPMHNLKSLMTEIYKTKCSFNTPFMKDIFTQRNNSYNLRQGNDAQLPKVRTTCFGFESITYLETKLWQILLPETKHANTLPIFKKQIRGWNGNKCNGRLAKHISRKLGF